MSSQGREDWSAITLISNFNIKTGKSLRMDLNEVDQVFLRENVKEAD